MNRRNWSCAALTVLLFLVAACSKKSSPQLIVEIPSGYSGNFSLEMGVNDAPPLVKQGDSYVVTVPRTGKVSTSTLLTKAKPSFRNSSDGAVWGYSHSVFATGDGIPISGKIEFFVGTRKEYEADQSKRNHSGGLSGPRESARSGA